MDVSQLRADMEAREKLQARIVRLGERPSQHEAYAALRAALIGSGVLTMAECEAWAWRIVAGASE